VVATPIGNLGDVTPRAAEVLGSVGAIASEDTRRTRKLLSHLGIRTPTIAYHEHNEERVGRDVLGRLESGEDVALVSDAGTPLVSDPGYRLVASCVRAGYAVVPLPGACAPVVALSAGGLPPVPFYFGGFLPRRPQARRRKLEELAALNCTLVFFESPHRLAAALRDMLAVLGDREAVVAREMTKLHEEFARGPLKRVVEEFGAREIRGEIVVLVAGADGMRKHPDRPGEKVQRGPVVPGSY